MSNCFYSIPKGSFVPKILLIHLLLLLSAALHAQCHTDISVLTGNESLGCTEVTVTSNGSVNTFVNCNIGPYWIGETGPGSYTFTFSLPIQGATLDFDAFDNTAGAMDEVRIRVNGVPYVIPDPGDPNGCRPLPVIVSGTGTLLGTPCPGPPCTSSCDGIQINQVINSIIVEALPPATGAGVYFSIAICCSPCRADAGILTNPDLNLCEGNTVTVPPATSTNITGFDMLEYILFSNPSDTIGSIVAISSTPSFAFNPATMQTSVPYYIAAAAGGNLNGFVNLNDLCLDFSNAIQVIWWPLPTVSFSVDQVGVCAGECMNVTANFTGTAPFELTYTNSVSGTLMQSFAADSGTIEVCGPPGSLPGNIFLQAIKITDGHCTCN